MVTLSEVSADDPPSSAAQVRDDLIARGNSLFVDEDWEGALRCYSAANDALPGHPSPDALLRRAAVHIRTQNYEDAVADAQKAIEIAPTPLAYLRKGVAMFELEEHEWALKAFQAGAALDPGNKDLQKWIRKSQEMLQEAAPDEAPAPSAPDLPAAPAPTPAPTSASAPTHTLPSGEGEAAPSVHATETPPPARFRKEWYQSGSHVVITVFAKGVQANQLHCDFGEQVLSLRIDDKAGEEEPYILALRLFGKIVPQSSKYSLLSSKVEVKLAKAEAIHWAALEAVARAKLPAVQPIFSVADAPNAKSSYPTSSKHKVDWNKLEMEVKNEEKDEKLEGDAGLNKFFQQIYGDADEDTRRAMNKSFQESGGTVLSTNWKDVGTRKVEAK